MEYLFRVLVTALFFSVSTCPLFAQWVQTSGSYSAAHVTCFAKIGSNLFAGHGTGILLSTDNGTSWKNVITGLTNTYVQSLVVSGSNLFAGTYSSGVFLSTDNGTSWSAAGNGLTHNNIRCLASSGRCLYAGTLGGGVYLSTNNGTNWTAVNNGLTDPDIDCIAVSDKKIFAGTHDCGVYLSTNDGASWTAVNNGLTNTSVRCINIYGSDLIVGTSNDYKGGLFYSSNNGTSWTDKGITVFHVSDVAISGSNIFAGGWRIPQCKIVLSTNYGTSWFAVDSGMTYIDVRSLIISGTYLFAGTEGDGIWRRPLAEMITSVEQSSNNQPIQYGLEQNYPNPFNPNTNINYRLPQSGQVTIKVYDVLGNEVKTLVNEYKPAGEYSVNFDAGKLSSGVYIYRLTAGGYTTAKKMTLIK